MLRESGHRFYPVMGSIMLAIVLAGFGLAAIDRGQNPLELPLLFHLHAAAFLSWYALFIVQASLIRKDHRTLHIKLGTFSPVVVTVMMVTGILMVRHTLEQGVSPIPNIRIEQFVAFPTADLAGLGTFYTLALLRRSDGAFHKRAMLLTLIAIIDPAAARCGIALGFPPLPLLVSLGLIGALIWHDRKMLGRVHAITWFGLAWILLRPAFVFGFAATDFWMRMIAGIV